MCRGCGGDTNPGGVGLATSSSRPLPQLARLVPPISGAGPAGS